MLRVLASPMRDIRDDGNTNARDWKIGARLSFRTLGGIGTGDVESPLLKPSF
jgi:LPS-assembly protein